jgi:hypothetical protein
VIHRPLRYGHSAAVQWGLREAQGSFVIIYNNRACPVALEIRDLWDSRLHAPPRGCRPAGQARRASHGSLIDDHGFVFEAGPLIMVHRWERADAPVLEDFVRLPGDRSHRSQRKDDQHPGELVARPYHQMPRPADQFAPVW